MGLRQVQVWGRCFACRISLRSPVCFVRCTGPSVCVDLYIALCTTANEGRSSSFMPFTASTHKAGGKALDTTNANRHALHNKVHMYCNQNGAVGGPTAELAHAGGLSSCTAPVVGFGCRASYASVTPHQPLLASSRWASTAWQRLAQSAMWHHPPRWRLYIQQLPINIQLSTGPLHGASADLLPLPAMCTGSFDVAPCSTQLGDQVRLPHDACTKHGSVTT